MNTIPAQFDWERGFNRNLILGKLKEARKPDGRSFDAGEYEYWLPVLSSAIRSKREAEPLKAKCIRASLSDASLTLNDPDAFIVRCDQEFERLSKRPLSKFILYTTVTYSGPKLIDWIGDDNARIYWQPSMSGNFMRKAKKAQKVQEYHRKANKVAAEHDALTPIIVHVFAYDAFDAFERANDYVDRFRGMLNLLINSGNSINPFGRLAAPHAVNKFRRGPFHSIHRPDGSLATETFWYEPRWAHNASSVEFKDPPDYRRSLQRWWRKLQENPMREFISDALLRYCRALDLHEADASLLGMWQVLEKVTGTDKYDLLIDRLVRLFRDHEDAREIANHVRLRRNQTVHSTHNISREAGAILMQTEMLASQAIFFYLENAAKFENQREIFDFLDLPLDRQKLRRQRKISDFFVRYQSGP
ncbi:hypothetical protein KMZ29_02615 [Bradyrhizobium sediminis]|uniref:Apea-like HEPN domain-containing protein n=1 Tax=Bradyrhizobium sediminis TaxID=2840469 RepID=A0A975RNC2_9BRAD|nr:hypothetical protein [Bradyrhizobium sediminis]QWG13649.1 hypothetical protein KMZ29_02615 [Bradyrhizobium sediminis]